MYKNKLSILSIFLALFMMTMIGCDSVQAPTENLDDSPQLSHVEGSTVVPGHQDRYDSDDNGYPDEGEVVNGKYTSLYAYDASGDWYWDLGDGRVQGNVNSVAELDQSTLTTCDYQVTYRGTFDNDPFMDSGWIKNNINCSGYDDNGNYNYTIVHETDPRYTGNPDWAIWNTWEYHAYVVSGEGNLVRPENHAGE